MPKIETTAWFDGELVPVQEIRVSALSHSLHYGTGIFEGLRCYAQTGGGGGIFRLRVAGKPRNDQHGIVQGN